MSLLKEKKTDPVKRAKNRLLFALCVFLIIFTAIAFRLADLTLVNFGKETLYALTQKDPKFNGYRASILDRNGEPLALSLELKSLYADAKLVRDPTQTAKRLKKLFPDLSEKKLEKNLKSKKRFVWIKRHLTPKQQYAVNRLGIVGLDFKDEYKRFYPQGDMTAHVIGYTNRDNRGVMGIEKSFDSVLTQDAATPITVTLDSRIQHAAHFALNDAIKKFKAKAGAALVMHAKTGEILSLVSLPSFNPHTVSNPNDPALFNRATLGVFEMGSTFKIFSAAASLEKGGVKITDHFDCTKPLKYGRFTINDFHAEERVMSVPEIFMHSSNIGHVLMTRKVGTEKLQNFYRNLGLLERPEFDLPETTSPLLPSPWREINTATASYGHGIAVSPLNLMQAAGTVINGGFAITPHLVERKIPLPESILSEKTSNQIRELLRLTVTEGTGKNSTVSGYLVGGKTGTSEKLKNGSYSKKSLISSFIGMFPMNNPEYIVYVMVDEPVGNQSSYGYATGGWVAAPAVQSIIERIVSIMGIPPLDSQTVNAFDTNLSVRAALPDSINISVKQGYE